MAEKKQILARALLIFGTVLLCVYLWAQQSRSQSHVNKEVFTPLSNFSYAGSPRAQPDLDHNNDGDWEDRIDIGSWLVCMMNQPLDVRLPQQSRWTNHADLQGYGWRIRERARKDPNAFKLDDPFDELDISMNRNDWTKVQALHNQGTLHNGVTYPETDGEYQNYYDPRDGVIVAEHNFGPEFQAGDSIPRNRIVPLRQWSDILYLTWRHQAQANQYPGNLQNLRHIFRINVITDVTKKAIRDVMAHGGRPIEDLPPWPGLQYKLREPEAKVLMSTPHASGVAWLLMQHKAQLGVGVIDEIRIFSRGESPSMNMYIHVTRGPLPFGKAR